MMKNKINSIKQQNEHPKPLILRRDWVVFFCFSGCFIMFFLRYNLSVAVVAIADEKIEIDCPLDTLRSMNDFNSTKDDSDVICFQNKYNYDKYMTAQFLAAYFYGYAMFQLPVGRFSEKFNCAKELIGYGVLLSGILTLVAPFMLDLGAIAFILTRFLIGVLHASILCCSYTLFADWLPKEKKGNAITWCNIGFEFGGMVSFFLTGYISSIDYLGWRYSFYLFSIVSFIWFIPFHFLVYSRPEDDPNLSEYELNLLKKERKAEHANSDEENFPEQVIKILPKFSFKIILTSKPVWASLISKFASGLGYYIITTKIPDYLSEVFNTPIKQNGFYSGAPFLGILISKVMCLKLSDFIINLNIMSLTNVRKLFQSISMFTPTVCLLLLTFKNDNREIDILMIFLAMLGQGMVCAGDSAITAEFGGQLSGSIFGFTNTLACSNGFLAPLLTSLVLENISDKFFAWNIIFYIAIIVYFFGGIFFICFASAIPQSWAQSSFIIETTDQVDSQNESPA